MAASDFRGGRVSQVMLAGASMIALVIAAPAFAQQADPASQADAPPQSTTAQSQTGTPANGSLPRSADNQDTAVPPAASNTDDVVVTGLRQSIETAQAIKFNADQFVDSITATDIGKLPDRNVAEALQRISGVQIDRNYGEGSGLAIRGLTQVKTELNGRDVFGGSGGRSLGFEDVPSELLSGVDVYKDPSAKEIEGGIGGLVNLRTRMPFDEKGFLLSASMGVNYFDLADDARFNGSVLASKTWSNTGIGDFGILVDLSHYEGRFRRDQVSIEPYVPVNNLPGYAGQTLSIPDGTGIQVTDGRRKRKGIYAAAQWEPASNLQFYGTYFRSQYDIYTPNYSAFVTRSTSTNFLNYLEPYGQFQFDDAGNFVKGGFSGFRPPYTGIPGPDNSTLYVDTALNVADNTQVTFNRSVTSDFAGGVKWQPTDRLHVTLDLQYVKATARNDSYTSFGQKDLSAYYIDLSGDLPQISFANGPTGTSIYDPAAYRYTAVMDHFEDSKADQKAGRLDLQWDFDGGFLTSLQGGLRYTDRSAVNRSTPYNWTPAATRTVTNANGTTSQVAYTLADPISRGITNPYANDFFGIGGNSLIGPVPFASFGLFDDPAATFQAVGGRALTTFGPQDINTQGEKTYSGYAIAYFKLGLGLPIDGNVAVRVVKTTNEAEGSTRLSYRSDLLPTTGTTTVDQPFSSSQDYTKFLPSINLRAHVSDRLQARFGASKGLSRPSFYDLRAIRTLSIGYTATTVPAPTADNPNATVPGPYIVSRSNTGSGGNPDLKPLTVDQADVALEWNVSRSTFAYGTLFYKKLKNFTTTRVFNVDYAIPGQGTQTFSYSALVNGTKGTVKGFEVGGNTFFDFLPGALSGFGAQANATYVDSDAAGDGGLLANGDPVPTQLQGLSKWSYNLVGLYEKYGLSARLAYNWRSSNLQTIAGNGTGAVPIYVRPYGQLDASVSFNFSPKVSMTIDATNLTKERYDTYQYYKADPRNYELNDRRFGLTFRMRT